MKYNLIIILPLTIYLIITVFGGCNKTNEKHLKTFDQEEMSMDDPPAISENATVESANGFISSSAAIANDTIRKLIRTADLKFRVKNIRKASLGIEDITASFDGFVTYTNLFSKIDRTEIIPVSADSSLETIYFTVENNMIIRVPKTNLDSMLRTIAVYIDYMDYRIIKTQDVTLSLISNQMEQTRLESHSKRVTEAVDDKGKKLNETTKAEESLLNKQEQLDKSKLSTLSIQDQIDFSTINLHIYQRQAVKRNLIENYKNITAYHPSFTSQVWESVLTGWNALKNIMVGLISIWPLILVLIFGLIIYKYFRIRKN